MHVRTTGLLLLAPLAALLLPNLVLSNSDGFWWQLLRFREGTLYHADAVIRLADPDAVDIVVMGSSVAHTDVRQETLDERLADLDVHTVNVGVNGAAVPATAMQLPDALQLEPRLVILVNAAPSMFRRRRARQPEAYHRGVALDLYGAGAFLSDRDRHLSGLLQSVSLVFRYRRVPRDLWSADFDGAALRDSERLTPEAVAGSVARQQRVYQSVRKRNHDPVAGDALCLMQAYTERAGAQLLVVPAPVHPSVRRRGYDRHHVRVLSHLQKRCGFHLLAPGDLPWLGALAYRDGSHLLPIAQEAFTEAVAAGARAVLEGE